MTIATAESGLLTTVRKIAGYDTTNVLANDYRALTLGKSSAIVERRGPGSKREEITLGNPVTMRNDWEFILELYVLFNDELPNQAGTINTEAQKVIDIVNQWPNLSATAGIINATADALGEPESWVFDNSRYWRQEIVVRVLELETVSRSE